MLLFLPYSYQYVYYVVILPYSYQYMHYVVIFTIQLSVRVLSCYFYHTVATCPTLDPPEYGFLSLTDDYYLHSEAHYQCITTADLIGTASRLCKSYLEGVDYVYRWTGKQPECRGEYLLNSMYMADYHC